MANPTDDALATMQAKIDSLRLQMSLWTEEEVDLANKARELRDKILAADNEIGRLVDAMEILKPNPSQVIGT